MSGIQRIILTNQYGRICLLNLTLKDFLFGIFLRLLSSLFHNFAPKILVDEAAISVSWLSIVSKLAPFLVFIPCWLKRVPK